MVVGILKTALGVVFLGLVFGTPFVAAYVAYELLRSRLASDAESRRDQ